MTSFLHHPTDTIVTATGPRAARYRRNSNFVELGQSPPGSPDSYQDALDSPASSPHDPDTGASFVLFSEQIARMTVAEVLDAVVDEGLDAADALRAELTGRNRSTLIAALLKLK